MTYFEIFLLAIALSIDACVVSFSYGLVLNFQRSKNALLLAIFTSVFQGVMPVMGYMLTGFVKSYLSDHAKLIVCLIFVFLGLKFIKESFETKKNSPVCLGMACLFFIGLATSIDAFSSGISLALYGNHILKPAILIAVITFINSLFGFKIGGKFKCMPTARLEFFAGLILVGLGLKALFS